VSSTTDVRTGLKYDWADLAYMEGMQSSLSIIYYCLFGFMAVFAFIIIPFAYFYYEEWDEGISSREVISFQVYHHHYHHHTDCCCLEGLCCVKVYNCWFDYIGGFACDGILCVCGGEAEA
jgi:hypothetical protein